MHWSSGWRRLTRLWEPGTARRVDEEIRFHFDQKIAEFRDLGMTEEDARSRAASEFGDERNVRGTLLQIDERLAQRNRRAAWWEHALQDLRFVVRSLRRSPVFTVTVVLTLALGLGANAAVYSLLRQLYATVPAGIDHPDLLRRLYRNTPGVAAPGAMSAFDFTEVRSFREIAPNGVRLASYRSAPVEVSRAEVSRAEVSRAEVSRAEVSRSTNAIPVGAAFVEGDYFGVAGVRFTAGRAFSSDERAIYGASLVAIISDNLWSSRFDRNPDIIGQSIDVGAHRHIIVGVTAPGFRGLDLSATDVWLPLNSTGTLRGRSPDWYESYGSTFGSSVIARIANEADAGLFSQRATEVLRRDKSSQAAVATLGSLLEARDGSANATEVAISTRLGIVAFCILIVGCANVLNLLLARANTRRREIALRLALGISRARLVWQLLAETVVLSLLAASVALFIALVAGQSLRLLLFPDVIWAASTLSWTVVVIAFGLAMLVALSVGLISALLGSRHLSGNALRSSAGQGGQRSGRFRSTLTIVQTALSIVLLAGAGLFVQSLRNVEAVELGYDASQLLFARLAYDRELGDYSGEIVRRLPDALERLRRFPGVEAVAVSSTVPMNGFEFARLRIPGRDSLPSSGNALRVVTSVSPNYFSTVGIKLLRGQLPTDAEVGANEPIVLMNAELANNLWPGEDALGKCVFVGSGDQPCRRVTGIVSHAHFRAFVEEPPMQAYVPKLMTNGALVIRARPGFSPVLLSANVERELTTQFGDWLRPRMMPMSTIVEPSLRRWRVGASLFGMAAGLALLIAAVGVYSNLAYSVSQRSREMGVRVAIGASANDIIRLIVGQGLRVVATGVAIGIPLALALGSMVNSLLYSVSPRDPRVLAAATATLVVAAVIACAIPAWRASRADPLTALRAE